MKINFNSKIPIYLQIADMLRNAIIAGDLKEETPIPSVRQVAIEHGINHQTILKATQILIRDGILYKKRGQGMFIRSGAAHKLIKRETKLFIKDEITTFVNRAKSLGLNYNNIKDLLKNQFEEEHE